MVGAIQHLVRCTDAALARAYLTFFHEKNSLMVFLFHSLFRDAGEIAKNHIDPLERTTVEQFRQLVDYYVHHDYRFVTPADVLAGLEPNGKYAMITFDDGYHNNTLALPILETYRVPATFFISTNHIRQQKCFWWDVMYRERIRQGATPRAVYNEAVAMKTARTEDIEAELTTRFGPNAFKPNGDIDRPFTVAELQALARSPLVHIGNHTANHAILTNYSRTEMRLQLNDAQDTLREWTGVSPIAIAYPNGAHNDVVLQAAADAGLRIGVTTRPHKNPLPVGADSARLMRLGRFCPHNDVPILTQCLTYRSDVLVYGRFREGYLRLVRGQAAQY